MRDKRHAAASLRSGRLNRNAMSEKGLGCVKTPALSARVEKPRRDSASGSQIILRTDRSMQCGRIVFYTFWRCMSFHTTWVIKRNTRSEDMQ
jgi:hypothetical protein